MSDQGVNYKEELLNQIEGFPPEKVKEILDAIDASQAFFWTKKWQDMEAEADQGKDKGNVFGDGAVDGLLRELGV
jgi:hypothetical protein